MDTKFLLSTNKPLFLSYKTHPLQTPKHTVKSHLSESRFLGKNLVLEKNPRNSLWNGPRRQLGTIRAVVKRRKEVPLDNVIQRDKKLKLVMRIRKILVEQPDRTMSLRQLGKFRKDLGLDKRRRFIALLRKFPAVFEIVEEGVFSLKFRLTPEAERLYFEELKIRNGMEGLHVAKLRKLLMMSLDKRILLEKIAHLKNDLGLPLEFRDTICQRYPQYFRVVATGRGPALELTHWDPELAVSASELSEEENRAREIEEKNLIIDRVPRFNRVRLPKGLLLSKGEMRRIERFRDIPYVSPYSDFSGLRSGSDEKEKHACAVVHEILSMTVEKKTLVDHLTHFREEFRFSQQIRGMLIRHPNMFYVSLKGDRDSVFLREAYRNSHLIDRDHLSLVKEKFRSLVEVPRFPRRGGGGRPGPASDDGSDVEGLASGGDGFDDDDGDDDDYDVDVDDDDNDDDDDWSDDDEDDDMPPDFGGDGLADPVGVGVRRSSGRNEIDSRGEDEKVLEPVLPDGRPRERW